MSAEQSKSSPCPRFEHKKQDPGVQELLTTAQKQIFAFQRFYITLEEGGVCGEGVPFPATLLLTAIDME